MRQKKTLIIGIICGICCAVCVGLYLYSVTQDAANARAEALAKYGGDQLEVCVATRNISTGETIDEGAIETKLWVADLLPDNAVSDKANVIGKQAGSSIIKGEVISEQRFSQTDRTIDVPAGLTAVSVPAQDVQAVGGVLGTGMYVDVYAVSPASTDLILSQTLIVATSMEDADSSSGSSWVTLAVPTESVQEVITAAQNLELYFVLPNHGNQSGEGTGE